MAVEERLPGEYLFKFQFFIHDCSLTKDFYNIHKPAIAIRFLDFPTLILEGTNYLKFKFQIRNHLRKWKTHIWIRKEVQLQNAQ